MVTPPRDKATPRDKPPPRRESTAGLAVTTTTAIIQRRPGMKHRASSAPVVPKLAEKDMHCHDDSSGRAESTSTSSSESTSSGDHKDDDTIADDAFFQRYHLTHPNLTAEEPSAMGSGRDSSSDIESPLSPAHVDTTLAMADLTIAVLGAPATGKSTLIRCALGLPEDTPAASCVRPWTVDGAPYLLRLLELPMHAVRPASPNPARLSARHALAWPKTIDGMATPRIDAAVTVYDVTARDSLADVPEMLGLLASARLPVVLAACKCDQPPAHRQVDPTVVEQKAKSFIGDIAVFQTSHATPDSHRACIAAIAHAALAARRPRSQASLARRRANSSAVQSTTKKNQWKKHERASSEISVRYPRGSADAQARRFQHPETSQTFFNAEDSPGSDSHDSDTHDSDYAPSIMSVLPSDENGYTFEQLVTRLLAQPMSKDDTKFVSIFLALYRRFATPGQLLETVLKRFEQINHNKDLPMVRIINQLRYLALLRHWVAYYPGDFAYPTTRRLMHRFASGLASNREYSVAATEILQDLDLVIDDDDTDWACSDRQRAQHDQTTFFHNKVLGECSTEENNDDNADEFVRAIDHMSMGSDRMSIARSSATGATLSPHPSSNSTQTLLSLVERNEKLARKLEPNPLRPLSKLHWHQFMAESDEAIARELTRMDWIMFSSIRPRDLVRHVSLNAEDKKRCKNLENVTRMIEHFNHIACLVTNYILLRDKPKHRAQMMEKWMRIARQLRILNNYNSLGAVHAGVKGTSVHRLLATRDLVPQAVGNDFLKIDILMGSQRSHGSYRLAWKNSSGQRIPFIPLHLRDLVAASEGNSTLVSDKKKTDSAVAPHPGVNVFEPVLGKRDSKEPPASGVAGKERINWRKFEIMGEVIVGVQRAQGTPYPNWLKREEVRNLVLDVKVNTDDEDLYERSTHLEAPGAYEKGRFAKWFRER